MRGPGTSRARLPSRWSWRAWSWALLTAAAVAAYGLAVAFSKGPVAHRLIDGLKLLPGGFPGYTSGSSWEYLLARHLAALVTVTVAARVLFAVFADRTAEIRAGFRRGHVVVCGLGDTGLRSARAYRAAGEAVTCIDVEHHSRSSTDARALGALVVQGDATQFSVLKTAGVERAKVVVCTCPDDTTNTQVAAGVVALAQERRHVGPLNVHVELSDPDLAQMLRAPLASAGAVRLHFFNLSRVWARAMVDRADGLSTQTGPRGHRIS